MMSLGFWKTKIGYVSHKNGLNEEQVQYLHNFKVGDRISLFVNDVREGETGPFLTLKRSTLLPELNKETTNA